MGRSRQMVLTKRLDEDAPAGELAPLGSLDEVLEVFSRFNTSEDGSPRRSGMVVLHGPGMIVEIPTFSDTINQAMVTLKDDDYAFTVLWRLCRSAGWKMTDPETGQSFG